MALNICNRINRNIPKTCMGLLSQNAQNLVPASNALAENLSQISTAGQVQGNTVTAFDEFLISSKQQTSEAVNRNLSSSTSVGEHDIFQRNLADKYLQPATLPSYCEKPISDTKSLLTHQDQKIQNSQPYSLNSSASQKIFEHKKNQCQNHHKKFPKLMSNPFPDPIKTAFSPGIMSDKDKQQQMLDDQKMAQIMMEVQPETQNVANGFTGIDDSIKPSKKFYSTMPFISRTSDYFISHLGFNEQQKRFYRTGSYMSKTTKNIEMFRRRTVGENRELHGLFGAKTIQKSIGLNDDTPNNMVYEKKFSSKSVTYEKDLKKYPKAKSCQKVTPKMRIKGCPPPRANTTCKQMNKEVKCVKVEAPYPSYSESCYMEPKSRNSECDVCPWTPKTNPHFKGRLQIPPKKYHTDCVPNRPLISVPVNCTAKNLASNFQRFSTEFRKNPAQAWIRSANLSQICNRKSPTEAFYNFGNFGGGKDMSPDPCQATELRKSTDYLKSHIEKKSGNKSAYELPEEIMKLGYCDITPTALTEFFMRNDNLLVNFRNGDDLEDFGINKAKLSKLLSSREVFEISCKKGERLIPDYPRGCEHPYEDKTKTCPTGLTTKKTKKDRLKKKKPKVPTYKG